MILGMGATMPLPDRPLSAAVIRHKGRLYSFDGGEGVQVSFKRMHLGFKSITVMAVSHLHADHCLGLPGLLMMRARSDEVEPLTILGPHGIERFIRNIRRDLDFYINYDIRFIEWDETMEPCSVAYEDENVIIRWAAMKHTTDCVGYLLEERERPGKFKPDKAVSLGIPKGPLWGRLQHGDTVTIGGDRIISPQQVSGPNRKGRRIAYITDTVANKNVYRLLKNADMALIEGMFHTRESDTAREKMHLTAAEAGRLCSRAGVSRAVLIHVSPRYEDDQLKELEAEAQAYMEHAEMGRMFNVYSVPLPD